LSVVERRNRRETATPQSEDAGALRLDTAARLGVVCVRHELLLALPHLERHGALPGLRQHLLRLEPPPDFARKAEPVEAAGREHDRVEPSLPALAQPRLD